MTEPGPPFHADAQQACPSCGAALPEGAVLCVACGYHLKLGRRLETKGEVRPEEPAETNPYAPPQAVEEPSARRGQPPVCDLTELGAKRAEAVAATAESLTTIALLALCACSPLWLALLPWCLYRLMGWYQLNAQFEELRHPNSLSPHADVALRFQAARPQLIAGVIAGSIAWIVLALTIVPQFLPPPR